VFGNTTPKPEGEVPLTSFALTTDAAGLAPFQVALPYWPVGLPITATATDPLGNTSEFGWVFVTTPAHVKFGGGPGATERR
jgi:hypothetical protein